MGIQKIYQVDAFSDHVFGGNPAAVCPLQEWLSDHVLQNIGMENNLAETAFYVKDDDGYQIRWFTPTVEVDLCGHATLAAAYVIFFVEGYEDKEIHFYSPHSGKLTVTKNDDDTLTLNFPSDEFSEVQMVETLTDGLNIKPKQILKGKTDYMMVYDNEEDIRSIIPAFDLITQLNARGVIVTAPGSDVDFVSRFFAPQSGVNEDPVTGSAHTTLAPYWSKRLGKIKLSAKQISSRTGYLECTYLNDRVEISGKAKLYMSGKIYLD